MDLKRSPLLLFAASALTWFVVRADAPLFRLTRQSATEHINPISEQRPVKWSHGAYLAMDHPSAQAPFFYTLDRDGEWTATAQFHNPEPTRMHVFGYDRNSRGTIIFSGETETEPRVVSPFLAWTSPDGKVQRMVRTGDYFPHMLAFAPDDTIWTLGYESVNFNPLDAAVNPQAHVLRHFNASGDLLESFLPQSGFSRDELVRLHSGLLAVGGDRLGWYAPRTAEGIYTEIPLDTLSLRRYPSVPVSSKPWLPESLALAAGGLTSVSMVDASPGHRTNYILDRASSHWVPVAVPTMGGFSFTPQLIGNDGPDFVFKYGGESGRFSVSQ